MEDRLNSKSVIQIVLCTFSAAINLYLFKEERVSLYLLNTVACGILVLGCLFRGRARQLSFAVAYAILSAYQLYSVIDSNLEIVGVLVSLIIVLGYAFVAGACFGIIKNRVIVIASAIIVCVGVFIRYSIYPVYVGSLVWKESMETSWIKVDIDFKNFYFNRMKNTRVILSVVSYMIPGIVAAFAVPGVEKAE